MTLPVLEEAAMHAVRAFRARHVLRRAHRNLPLGNASDQLRVALVADECPAFLVTALELRPTRRQFLLDERLGILKVPVDGLDSGGDAIFLVEKLVNWAVRGRGEVRVSKDDTVGALVTHLANLLAQHFRFDDHAFAVRRFPDGAREYRHIQLLHADADA